MSFGLVSLLATERQTMKMKREEKEEEITIVAIPTAQAMVMTAILPLLILSYSWLGKERRDKSVCVPSLPCLRTTRDCLTSWRSVWSMKTSFCSGPCLKSTSWITLTSESNTQGINREDKEDPPRLHHGGCFLRFQSSFHRLNCLTQHPVYWKHFK